MFGQFKKIERVSYSEVYSCAFFGVMPEFYPHSVPEGIMM